ncbi:unnamed protein product, partial [Vitis vinifera]
MKNLYFSFYKSPHPPTPAFQYPILIATSFLEDEAYTPSRRWSSDNGRREAPAGL